MDMSIRIRLGRKFRGNCSRIRDEIPQRGDRSNQVDALPTTLIMWRFRTRCIHIRVYFHCLVPAHFPCLASSIFHKFLQSRYLLKHILPLVCPTPLCPIARNPSSRLSEYTKTYFAIIGVMIVPSPEQSGFVYMRYNHRIHASPRTKHAPPRRFVRIQSQNARGMSCLSWTETLLSRRFSL
jgi:hypothetical protein